MDSLGISIAVVASVVSITWGICIVHLVKFLRYRRENGQNAQGSHRRSRRHQSHDTSTKTAQISARTVPSTAITSIAASTEYGGGPTTYMGGMTTMLQGATTMMTVTELSIPGFLNIQINADFQCGRVIARGGAGVIYQAAAISPGVKERSGGQEIVAKGFGDSLEKMDEDYRNAFFQELALMWRFRNAPGFVRVFGYSETPAMIIMKFYRLGSMADFIHGAGEVSRTYFYSKKAVASMFCAMTKSIAIMHGAGYVHSDIKPGNVLLEADYRGELTTVLSDFGICQIVDESALRVKAFRVSQAIGASISYAAPEVLRFLRLGMAIKGESSIKKGDVYALACVLYEMLTRRVPWR